MAPISGEVGAAAGIAAVGAAATVAGAVLSQRGVRFSATLDLIAAERRELAQEWAAMRQETRAELVAMRAALAECERTKDVLLDRVQELEQRIEGR